METQSIRTFGDNRGAMKFVDTRETQQFVSVNHKNVFRGIHRSPYGKTITCLRGRAIDFVINFEQEMPRVEKFYLQENQQLYIPPDRGHGFLTLDEDTIILYQLEGKFNPELERNYHYADPHFGLGLPNGVVVSEKDKLNPFFRPIDYAVIGARGFLGQETCKILREQGKHFVVLDSRLENREGLREELEIYRPKYVICAAGISGKPTTAWCEDHQVETLYVNLTLQLQLCHLCDDLGIHLTIYGSGLVFVNDNGLYSDTSKPNLTSRYYSKVRGLLEQAVSCFQNILYLRILYPVSGSGHEKCFLSKMQGRVPDNRMVCMTVIPDLFPKIPGLIERAVTGTLNFTNPGNISLPDFLYICTGENGLPHIIDGIRVEAIGQRETSFILTTKRLKELCPDVLHIEAALKTHIQPINN